MTLGPPAVYGVFSGTASVDIASGAPVYMLPSQELALASGGAASTAVCVGLAKQPASADELVRVQYTGPVALAVEQWNEIVGGSSGLTPGSPYYLSGTAGQLSESASSAFPVEIGVALSPSILLLQPNGVSAGGTGGGSNVIVGNEGAIIGNPVTLDFPEDALLALPGKANLLGTSEVAGIVTSIVGGVVTVQTSGIVTLTVDQWAAITGLTGIGLNTGNVYYLSDSTAGMLTANRPTSPSSYIARVGVALSATQLLLMLSEPILAAPPAIAAGLVTGGGSPSFIAGQVGFSASITRVGAGEYTFTLAAAQASANAYSANAIPRTSSAVFVSVEQTSGSEFTVYTFDHTGSAIDSDMNLVVTAI